MSDDLRRALDVATAVALEAGRRLRAELHRPGGPRGEQGHAPVDTEVEAWIRQTLTAAFPDDGFRAEEAPTENRGPSGHSRSTWLVDPNDGTSAFLKGHRGASVSIARLRDEVPVLGVIYAYAAPDDDGDLFAWAEGCGSLRRNGHTIGHPGWPTALAAHHIVLISNSADRRSLLNARCTAPARYRPVPGIAYRLALAAAGEGVAAISLFGARDFDYAAGHALLRGVGGELVDERGRPVRYQAERPTNVGFCFGGAPALLPGLVKRDWNSVLRAHNEVPSPASPCGPPSPTSAPTPASWRGPRAAGWASSPATPSAARWSSRTPPASPRRGPPASERSGWRHLRHHRRPADR
ncbi:MAG: inositol monophosphatase family protein [bacterium]